MICLTVCHFEVLFALLPLASLPASSQQDSVGVFPRWSKGEVVEYEVERTWNYVKLIDGVLTNTHDGATNSGKKENHITISVVDSSSTGYRLEWRFGRAEIPDSESARPLRVEFTTDPNGVFKDILNGNELRQFSTDMNQIPSPVSDKQGSLAVQRALMQMLLFHRPYGFSYSLATVQSFNIPRRIPLSDEVVEFHVLAELKKFEGTGQRCLLLISAVIDTDFGRIMADYVVGLDEQWNGLDVQRAISATSKSTVMDWYVFDTETFWIRRATRRIRIEAQDFSYHETLTLALPGEPSYDDDIPPTDFVAVERVPEIMRQVKPDYPELAMRAGLEGRVWVTIWVDKEGKPREVVILKSDAEIFNEPSIRAAKKFLFNPAFIDNKPVSVWVSVPFNFRLRRR